MHIESTCLVIEDGASVTFIGPALDAPASTLTEVAMAAIGLDGLLDPRDPFILTLQADRACRVTRQGEAYRCEVLASDGLALGHVDTYPGQAVRVLGTETGLVTR